MAILATGNTFNTGDSVTATMLNNSVNNATFASGAVDGVTTQLSGGAVIVKDGGITAAKLSTGGPTWTTSGALTAISIQNTPIGGTFPSSGTFTSISLSGQMSMRGAIERTSIDTTVLDSTFNFNWATSAVRYFTNNASGNWTLNVRASSTLTLNDTMANGESISFTTLCTQGSTAYYQSAMQIDGNAVTPKWAGGPPAPSAGNANSIDVYAFTIIKTAPATFTVLASQTKFA